MSTNYTVTFANHLAASQSAEEQLIHDTVMAAGMWLSSYIKGTGSIGVSIDFDPDTKTMVGSAYYFSTNLSTTLDGKSYALYQAGTETEILNGTDPTGTNTDLRLKIGTSNLDAYYWFDPTLKSTDDLPGNKGDGFRIVLTELIKGLGFDGWLPESDTTGNTVKASLFDALVENSGGRSFFTGANAEAAFGGAVPLTNIYLGDTQAFAAGQLVAPTTLMSDQVPFGERITLDPVTIGVLRDLGYTVRDTAAAYTGTAGQLNTVKLDNASTGYHVTHTLDLTWLSSDDRGDYTYRLDDIQRLQFTDTTIALDTGEGQHAGEAYRLYQAVFGRPPDSGGLSFWIGALDNGASLGAVADAFTASDEFHEAYASATTSQAIVERLYENVLHREGDPGGVAFWTKALDTHASSLAQIVAMISESDENVAALAQVIGNGFSYQPYT